MVGSGERKPSFRIPSISMVEEVIGSIMNEAFTVRSQTLFHRLVLMKLKDNNGTPYRLSAKRLRKIAARMEDVELIIHCREGKKRTAMTFCPVCGSKMDDIKNTTLYGWTVQTGKLCSICSYWTGKKKRIPTRYVFTLEKEKYLGEKMEVK